MGVVHRQLESASVLEFDGKFNFSARQMYAQAIETVRKMGSQSLIVNLEGVSFMDSFALGALVLTYQDFKKTNRNFCLLQPQENVRRGLTQALISKMIPIFDSEHEALSQLVIA